MLSINIHTDYQYHKQTVTVTWHSEHIFPIYKKSITGNFILNKYPILFIKTDLDVIEYYQFLCEH